MEGGFYAERILKWQMTFRGLSCIMDKWDKSGFARESIRMNIEWNADKYTNNFSFVHQYGNDVMELMDFENISTIIDLGCGNGALTEILYNKGLTVVGIDASTELLQKAKKDHPNIIFKYGDATNFKVDNKVDAVFSNAVFHWIDKEKQPDMLSCVYRALKSNGQFVFEFGGYGNNAMIHEALKSEFEKRGYKYTIPFYFPSVSEYASLVEQAGFQVRTALLFDRFTELKGHNGLKDWITMFIKTPFSVIKNYEEKELVIDEAVKRLQALLYQNGKWYADYVRLRMKALKR